MKVAFVGFAVACAALVGCADPCGDLKDQCEACVGASGLGCAIVAADFDDDACEQLLESGNLCSTTP